MFEELLAEIAEGLNRHGLPYMIIGGQAVLLYGEPRLTRDIDITLGTDTNGLKQLLMVIKEIALKILPEDVETFVKETMVLPTRDEKTGIRVDFIFSFTPYETEAIKRAKKVTLMNQDVNFVSVEDLIIHKIFAGRPRDLEDVRIILLKNPDMNINYIKDWLREFDKASEGKAFTDIFEEIINKA
jgi:predicted nucleotidyltransferase